MKRILQLLMIGGAILLLAGIGALSAQAAVDRAPLGQQRPTLTPERPTQPPLPTNTREPRSNNDDKATPTATPEPTATPAPAATAEPTALPTVEPTPTTAPASLPRTGDPASDGVLLLTLAVTLLLAGAGLSHGLKRKT
jgi:hypothetical protein